jgi:asparagine synthase (glutamine-hydrolysing)
MCGIAGILGAAGPEGPERTIRRMTDAMAHRGPDAGGAWQGEGVVLGHRRLSIIDLSSAADQPFVTHDGAHVIVFNGEIYNYRELRNELEKGPDAVRFRTASDTEVLLAAYRRWGADCLSRLHGMFAFAVWDVQRRELFLARDRMGIKPLYLYRHGNRLLFASELRALFASGLVPKALDPDALVDYLRYQTVHGPATMAKGVTMLQAGHWLRISGHDGEAVRWYDPATAAATHPDGLDAREAHAIVRERLGAAVRRRLVADVPFGAFLSGGIDSSAVVGLMAEASTAPVHTFSVVFDEEAYSEERFARIVARRFNTEHTAIRLRPSDMLRLLPDALAAMDHPSADGPNTFVVSKYTKEAGITMALSGLGGDEVFAGYPVFKRSVALWRKRWLAALPRPLRAAAARAIAAARPSIVTDKLGMLLGAPSFSVASTYPVSRLTFSDNELHRLLQRPELPSNQVAGIMAELLADGVGGKLPLLGQVSLGELSTYLRNVLLRDADQMTMAHALEVRVPFLDHELVEAVVGMPDAIKYPHTPKQLLTKALGDLLPHEIVHRPKMGFVLPWEMWMRNELKTFCTDRLRSLGRSQHFKPGALDEAWRRFLARDPRLNWSRIWALVVLGDWLERNGVEE